MPIIEMDEQHVASLSYCSQNSITAINCGRLKIPNFLSRLKSSPAVVHVPMKTISNVSSKPIVAVCKTSEGFAYSLKMMHGFIHTSVSEL